VARQKSPAFQFYPKDYQADENVRLMSPAERGWYVDLMCFEWIEGSIPDDPDALARLVGAQPAQFRKAWERIGPCFKKKPRIEGRLIHPRLAHERKVQRKRREKLSSAGRKGAEKVWGNSSQDKEIDSPATERPMASDGSSSSSASSTAIKDSTPPKGSPPVPAQEIIDAWNETCGDALSKAKHLTDKRRKQIGIRCRDLRKVVGDLAFDPEWWTREIFLKVRQSPFCLGENDRGWQATLDWLLDRKDAAVKAMEGQYDDTNGAAVSDRYDVL